MKIPLPHRLGHSKREINIHHVSMVSVIDISTKINLGGYGDERVYIETSSDVSSPKIAPYFVIQYKDASIDRPIQAIITNGTKYAVIYNVIYGNRTVLSYYLNSLHKYPPPMKAIREAIARLGQ